MITLMKFSAEWCQPCKRYAPIVQQVVGSRPEVRLEEIDIDKSPQLAAKFGVQSVPFTVLRDEEGTILGGFQGAVAGSKLHQILDTFL